VSRLLLGADAAVRRRHHELFWVALIATFILPEKVLPRGESLSYGVGAALIGWGGWTLYLQHFAA
jgi:predicted metal-binding membrane protein